MDGLYCQMEAATEEHEEHNHHDHDHEYAGPGSQGPLNKRLPDHNGVSNAQRSRQKRGPQSRQWKMTCRMT